MTETLNRRYSPLDQVNRHRHVAVSQDRKGLNKRDQALLDQILNGKCDYMPHPDFEVPNAEKKLFAESRRVARPDVSWYHPVMENLSPSSVPGKNAGTVLLTAAQEQALFLQFNYCRYRVAKLREQVTDKPLGVDQARKLLNWRRRADALKDQIAQTNLALVLAMAKRTRMTDVEFSELVSEGNLALLRAVDKFDAARGFKFSTYACRAILKAFSRIGVSTSKYRHLFPTEFDPKLERSEHAQVRRADHEDDCVDEVRLILTQNRAELTDIEQSVIEHRFGLKPNGSDQAVPLAIGAKRPRREKRAMTLEQVGRMVGLTKERVRQIQNKALDKVRQTLETDFLD